MHPRASSRVLFKVRTAYEGDTKCVILSFALHPLLPSDPPSRRGERDVPHRLDAPHARRAPHQPGVRRRHSHSVTQSLSQRQSDAPHARRAPLASSTRCEAASQSGSLSVSQSETVGCS
eukprot:2096091-Pyramimonas_sp.AAC.2